MMKLFLICVAIAAAYAQDGEVEVAEVSPVREGAIFNIQWPQNSKRLAGAEGVFALGGPAGLKGCTVEFPVPVEFFHLYNAYFNADSTSDGQTYEITTAVWANETESLGFVLNFMNGTDGEPVTFNASEIAFSCGGEAAPLGVYSTIVDDDQEDQLLSIQSIECFTTESTLQITFPFVVYNVTIDTQVNGTYTIPDDLSEGVQDLFVGGFIQSEDNDDYKCSGDQNKIFSGHFTFESRDARFSASQVVVSHDGGAARAEE